MRRLRQMQSRGGYGGGAGGPQMPRGGAGALLGGIFLVGGAMAISNALFNVDGGHRAIKYRRISGVSKEIYNEGEDSSENPGWKPLNEISCANQSKQAHISLFLGLRLRLCTMCERDPATSLP